MKIKKGDKVIVIAGKDRGTTSSVVRALPRENKVVVDGVNVAKRHRRGSRRDRQGQIVEIARPIDVSNVMLVDPKTDERTRVVAKRADGVYTRSARKSGTKLES